MTKRFLKGRPLLVWLVIVLGSSPSLIGAVGFQNYSGDPVDELITRAQAARDSGDLNQAAELYQTILKARSYWVEGWWNLATVLYDSDRYDEARDAFRRFLKLEPENGPAWALLGLNEYQTREYDRALFSLQKGLMLGLGNHEQLTYVTRYHTALLLNRFEEFEAAIVLLNKICLKHADNPKIIEAMGLSILRLPYLPFELPPDHREPVLLAGRAATHWAVNDLEKAAVGYGQLEERYPSFPSAYYALGVFALQYDPPSALGKFLKELELSPDHVPARLQLSFEYLKRGEPEKGRPYAERAVELAPSSFAARNALGRILLELGSVDQSIEQLEKGVELAPTSPQMHFALARAYTKAGRKEDARRSREEFLRLDAQVREREADGTPMIPSIDSEEDSPGE